MKTLIMLSCLIPVITLAQQKKAYLHIYGGSSWSNEATTKGILGMSAGRVTANAIGIGVGVAFIQFEKSYFPVTVDLSYLPAGKKVNPVAGIKAGYGFFDYHPSGVTTVRGGFVASGFAGISFSQLKFKPNLTLGGTRYTFRSTYPGKTVRSDDKRLSATIGFLF